MACVSGEYERRSAAALPACDVDMLITCAHANDMSRMVQIRNVPDTLHRTLKARAAHSEAVCDASFSQSWPVRRVYPAHSGADETKWPA